MSFLQSAASQVIGALFQLMFAVFNRDRRALIIERRAKVLLLAKEMKAAGLTATQLRALERRLKREN